MATTSENAEDKRAAKVRDIPLAANVVRYPRERAGLDVETVSKCIAACSQYSIPMAPPKLHASGLAR